MDTPISTRRTILPGLLLLIANAPGCAPRPDTATPLDLAAFEQRLHVAELECREAWPLGTPGVYTVELGLARTHAVVRFGVAHADAETGRTKAWVYAGDERLGTLAIKTTQGWSDHTLTLP